MLNKIKKNAPMFLLGMVGAALLRKRIPTIPVVGDLYSKIPSL
jgi:hypothetical protein